jgi:3-oxoacyl-[acyl-carrier-protein] synthase-3
MDGQELFAFTLKRVPALVRETLEKMSLLENRVRWFVFHQANAFMNERLRAKLGIEVSRMPVCLKDVGNTVSNTIPLTLSRCGGQFASGDLVMLVGFGVGYSWGSSVLEWQPIPLITA